MLFSKNLKGIAALVAVFSGVVSSASAQTTCTSAGCTCKYNWPTSGQICSNPTNTYRVANIQGINELVSGSYTVILRLEKSAAPVLERSSSAIPLTSSGALYPEACRATDHVIDSQSVSK